TATINGTVVWTDKEIPVVKRIALAPIPGRAGAVNDDSLLIDPKSKGVKNVMVWLAREQAGPPIPVAPQLAAAPLGPVTLTQTDGLSSPRITMMQSKQQLVLVNGLPVPDMFRIDGNPLANGSGQFVVPVAGRRNINLVAEKKPMLLCSGKFGWM